MKKIVCISAIIADIFVTSSCQPAVHERLTDEIYLIAPDAIEQVSVSYHVSGGSYSSLINAKLLAVGYNDAFVIAKHHPWESDSVCYSIIDVEEIKKEREKFVSKVDTIRSWSQYKNVNGKDSLGPEQIQIVDTKFWPREAGHLTFQEFKTRRKQLNVPDSLDFTIDYQEMERNRNKKP